jgi:hypothetical protein
MYRLYFPLMAMARYKRALAGATDKTETGCHWADVLPMAQ